MRRQLERGVRVRPDVEHGPAVRRRQLAARSAPRRVVRGAGGDRAGDRRRTGRRPTPGRTGSRPPATSIDAGTARSGDGRRRARRPIAGRHRGRLPPRRGPGDRRRRGVGVPRPRARPGRAERWRVPERAAAAPRPPRVGGAGLRPCSPIASCRRTTAAWRSARWPSPPTWRRARGRDPADRPRRGAPTSPPAALGLARALRPRRHDVVRRPPVAGARPPRRRRVRAPGDRRQARAAGGLRRRRPGRRAASARSPRRRRRQRSATIDDLLSAVLRRAEPWGLTSLWLGAGRRPPAGTADHVVWIDDVDPVAAAHDPATSSCCTTCCGS